MTYQFLWVIVLQRWLPEPMIFLNFVLQEQQFAAVSILFLNRKISDCLPGRYILKIIEKSFECIGTNITRKLYPKAWVEWKWNVVNRTWVIRIIRMLTFFFIRLS